MARLNNKAAPFLKTSLIHATSFASPNEDPSRNDYSESTRNLGKSTLNSLLTIATVKVSHSLYRYARFLRMSSSSSPSVSTDAETLKRNRILSSKLYFDVPLSKVQIRDRFCTVRF